MPNKDTAATLSVRHNEIARKMSVKSLNLKWPIDMSRLNSVVVLLIHWVVVGISQKNNKKFLTEICVVPNGSNKFLGKIKIKAQGYEA